MSKRKWPARTDSTAYRPLQEGFQPSVLMERGVQPKYASSNKKPPPHGPKGGSGVVVLTPSPSTSPGDT